MHCGCFWRELGWDNHTPWKHSRASFGQQALRFTNVAYALKQLHENNATQSIFLRYSCYISSSSSATYPEAVTEGSSPSRDTQTPLTLVTPADMAAPQRVPSPAEGNGPCSMSWVFLKASWDKPVTPLQWIQEAYQIKCPSHLNWLISMWRGISSTPSSSWVTQLLNLPSFPAEETHFGPKYPRSRSIVPVITQNPRPQVKVVT